MNKIDIHIHAALASNAENSEMMPSTAEEMLPYLAKKGVKKGILMSSGESGFMNNSDCMKISQKYPELYWCCNLDDVNPETVYIRMEEYKEAGAIGVGELMINKRLDSPILQSIFLAAEDLNMPIIIHMSPEEGYQYGIVDDSGLPLLEKVLIEHPYLKIVGHSQVFWNEISGDAPTDPEKRYDRGQGSVKPGGRLPELMRKYPNLYADLSAGSGYCAITRDEKFGLAFLEEFSDKLMFGTDTVSVNSNWNAPLAEWLEQKFQEGKLSEKTLEKICYKNAGRIFGIIIEQQETEILDTPCGKIKGIQEKDHMIFRGIRYATAERWKYPEIVRSWTGVYDATRYGNCSYQPRAFHSEALEQNNFYYKEFRKNEVYSYNDDCLFLNIWTPFESKELPVIVYIHGGAFIGGCGFEKHMNSPKWIKGNVIAVTINYRLGPFGFLCMEEAEKEAGHAGNYGLYDQVAALEWIRENIHSFGGDPNNITIMGQSAGAMSVEELCVSSGTDHLFKRAVMLSGGGTSPLFAGDCTVEENMKFGNAVFEATGCKTLDDMRKMKASSLFTCFFEQMSQQGASLSVISPAIDGILIKRSISESLISDDHRKIPYLLCTTSEDMVAKELFYAVRNWADAEEKIGNDNCYIAYFSRQLPGDDQGAWHSSDLWYWFGTFENCWRPMTEWDKKLSELMIQYLINFSKNGNPNGIGIPEWKKFSESNGKTMVFGNSEIEQKMVER